MDWEELYRKWTSEKIDGQQIFDKKLIPKINDINEYNRELYVEYHNYFLSDGSLSSYKNYRSKIFNFLTDNHIKRKKLYEITQEDLENYFLEHIYIDKATTFNSRVNYISDFFKFHKDKLRIELVFNKLLSNKAEIEKDKNNVSVPLTSEQIEFYRQRYYIQPIKLFLFEMVYYTGISLKDFRALNYGLFNKEQGEFILKNNKRIKVPLHLIPIVERLKNEWFFNANKDYAELINEIKKELREDGIVENFKYSDIIKTAEETAFIKCPECGEKFEAIANNWCVKQYYASGQHWIVCRKCGDINETK